MVVLRTKWANTCRALKIGPGLGPALIHQVVFILMLWYLMMLSIASAMSQANYWLVFCDLSQYDYGSE